MIWHTLARTDWVIGHPAKGNLELDYSRIPSLDRWSRCVGEPQIFRIVLDHRHDISGNSPHPACLSRIRLINELMCKLIA